MHPAGHYLAPVVLQGAELSPAFAEPLPGPAQHPAGALDLVGGDELLANAPSPNQIWKRLNVYQTYARTAPFLSVRFWMFWKDWDVRAFQAL